MTHRRNYVNGKGQSWINNQNTEEKKAKPKELDGGRTHRGGQRDATDAMEKVLPGSPGYGIGENILYHDNMRAMLLENNGNKSITKNTKQINVRYYFIKDRVETGDVVTEHCPTEKMLGGHFTKPLQGALFSKFRVEIMNIPDELDMGEMVMDGKGLRRGSHINCIKGLTLDAHMSVLGILKNWKEKWCYGVLKYWST